MAKRLTVGLVLSAIVLACGPGSSGGQDTKCPSLNDPHNGGGLIGQSAVCDPKAAPIVFDSAARNVAAQCGRILAKPSLAMDVTIDSSHHYSQAVDDFLRTTSDDKR